MFTTNITDAHLPVFCQNLMSASDDKQKNVNYDQTFIDPFCPPNSVMITSDNSGIQIMSTNSPVDMCIEGNETGVELSEIATDWLEQNDGVICERDLNNEWRHIGSYLDDYMTSRLYNIIDQNKEIATAKDNYSSFDLSVNDIPSTIISELEVYSDIQLNTVTINSLDCNSTFIIPEKYTNTVIISLNARLVVSKTTLDESTEMSTISPSDVYFADINQSDNNSNISITNCSDSYGIFIIVYYLDQHDNEDKLAHLQGTIECHDQPIKRVQRSTRRKLCFRR